MKTIKCVESKAELEAAYAIRFKVFVDEQKVPEELELDEHDEGAVHLLALEDGLPVGCGRLVFFEEYAQIGRVAVLREKRGGGFGKIICEGLLEIARESGAKKVILHSQCAVQEFYSRLGFVAEGEVFDDAGIDHICMALAIDS